MDQTFACVAIDRSEAIFNRDAIATCWSADLHLGATTPAGTEHGKETEESVHAGGFEIEFAQGNRSRDREIVDQLKAAAERTLCQMNLQYAIEELLTMRASLTETCEEELEQACDDCQSLAEAIIAAWPERLWRYAPIVSGLSDKHPTRRITCHANAKTTLEVVLFNRDLANGAGA